MHVIGGCPEWNHAAKAMLLDLYDCLEAHGVTDLTIGDLKHICSLNQLEQSYVFEHHGSSHLAVDKYYSSAGVVVEIIAFSRGTLDEVNVRYPR